MTTKGFCSARWPRPNPGRAVTFLWAAVAVAWLSGCGRSNEPEAPTPKAGSTVEPPAAAVAPAKTATATIRLEPQTTATKNAAAAMLREKLGIQVEGIKVAAGGYFLDFQYRVLDPRKATPLLNKKVKPTLADQASGAQLLAPAAPKLPALRSRRDPKPNESYSILFANPGKSVKPGSKVTVTIGDVKIENLVVKP